MEIQAGWAGLQEGTCFDDGDFPGPWVDDGEINAVMLTAPA